RVPGNEQYTGQLASEGSRNLKDRVGVFEFSSLDGDLVVSGHAVSTYRWVVGVAVKKTELLAATWNATRWATIFGGGFSILSLVFAGAIARGIVGPIAELRQKTAALLTGSAPSMSQHGPREVRDLWQALTQSVFDRNCSERAARESDEKLRLALEAAELGT